MDEDHTLLEKSIAENGPLLNYSDTIPILQNVIDKEHNFLRHFVEKTEMILRVGIESIKISISDNEYGIKHYQ